MQLPNHIKFSQSLKSDIQYTLSDSCGPIHSLASLSEIIAFDVAKLTSEQLGYASLRGDTELRHLITQFHQKLNCHRSKLGVDHVLTFSGAQEALAAAYRAILKPGDEVVVMTPCYPSLFHMAKQLGCKVKKIPVTPNKELTYACFERCISEQTKLVVINSPHNPTGAIIDSTLAERLFHLCLQNQCYVVCDDVTQASNFDNLALGHRFLDYDKALVVSVMSKCFGLPGVRLGWLISSNKSLINKLLPFKTYGSICTSKLDEAVAKAVLADWQTLVDVNNRMIKSNINKFEYFCQLFPEFISWHAPHAGILSLAKIHIEHAIEPWCVAVARQKKLLMLPANLFGMTGPYVRIGLGNRQLGLAIEQLAGVFNTPLELTE